MVEMITDSTKILLVQGGVNTKLPRISYFETANISSLTLLSVKHQGQTKIQSKLLHEKFAVHMD